MWWDCRISIHSNARLELQLPTIQRHILRRNKPQSCKRFCKHRLKILTVKPLLRMFRLPASRLTWDYHIVLVGQAPVDEALEMDASVSFRADILHFPSFWLWPGIQQNEVCTSWLDTVFLAAYGNRHSWEWETATHVPRMNLKRSMNVSFNLFQLLDHSNSWRAISWDRFRKRCWLGNTWILRSTIIENSPALFPLAKPYWRNLKLHSSTVGY